MITAHTFILAGLPVVAATADRFAGGPWMGAKPVLHPRYIGAAALALYCGAGFGLPAVSIGFAFLAWRSLGWEHFGGDMDPKTWRAVGAEWLIHAAWAPLAAICALLLGQPWQTGVAVGLAFACWAAGLAGLLGLTEARTPNANAYVEAARGFGLGALLILLLA